MSEPTAPAGWYDDGTGRQRWFDGTEWGAYADGASSPAAVEDGPVVVRRTRRHPFTPPESDADGASLGFSVSRSWGQGLRSARGRDAGLTRNREIAGDLPTWTPLPPGELGIDRAARRPR